MATLQSHVPASVRNLAPTRRANSGNPTSSNEDSRPYLIAGRKGRTTSTVFLTLPDEPEDAKITGGTRSLARRLLGLNLCGSLVRETVHGTVVTITTLTGVRIA